MGIQRLIGLTLMLCIAILSLSSCKSAVAQNSTGAAITHELFDGVLKKYVNAAGFVNYQGLKADRLNFDKYIKLLEGNHPNNSWSKDERLAYWINAYNAFTIQMILDNYPVESIKDIKNGIPFVNTVWDIKFINIEGAEYDLNNIEHGKIRKQFDEPRIHFAVNCASYSCPKLLNRAFKASTIEQQLQEATIYFFSDTTKNRISKDKLELSSLLKWYRVDFTKNGSLIDFINKYTDVGISADADIDYMDYSWKLNKQ